MSKKASQKLQYDFDDDDDDYPRGRRFPIRSNTVANLKSPYDYDDNNDVDSDSLDDPYEFDDEEEYDDFEDEYHDEDKIKELFTKLKKAYDISKCNETEIIRAYRNLDYDYQILVKTLERGEFGEVHKKKLHAKFEPHTVAKPSIASKDIKRSRSLADVSAADQHLTTKVTKSQVEEYNKNQKKHVNLVIVGHVDAGKSTLIGHVLLLTNSISKSDMDKIVSDSKATGHGQESLAWIMAEDETERQRGVTIDVSLTNFETEDRKITVLDAPGHRDFVPNMIAGASQSDSAVLVVDVSNPNIEKGQAAEHLLLCKSLGVSNLIVAINKMDSMDYDQSAFEEVIRILNDQFKRVGWKDVHFVPTVATNSEVLLNPRKSMPWYKGKTIIEEINSIPPYSYDINASFLMCASETIENSGNTIIVSGRVESGYVACGDNVRVLPADQLVRVSDISLNGEPVDFAPAGYIADITLQTSLNSEQISIGAAVFDPKRKMQVTNRFVAQFRTFDIKKPIFPGTPLVFHRHAVDLTMKVESFTHTINIQTKQPMKKGVKFVLSNQLVEATFVLPAPIPMETAEQSRSFGSFIVRANGETLGFGKVVNVLPLKEGSN